MGRCLLGITLPRIRKKAFLKRVVSQYIFTTCHLNIRRRQQPKLPLT
jgi:hypothetical protein